MRDQGMKEAVDPGQGLTESGNPGPGNDKREDRPSKQGSRRLSKSSHTFPLAASLELII